MTHERFSMGEVTTAAQCYPTQVWIPLGVKDPRQRSLALVHDRRWADTGETGTFFIPGNQPERLMLPGTESHVFPVNGKLMSFRIPDALLWENHGGPCEGRGAGYRRIGAHVMDKIYETIDRGPANRVILSAETLNTRHDYTGPFDYPLIEANGEPIKAFRPTPMDPDLLYDSYLARD